MKNLNNIQGQELTEEQLTAITGGSHKDDTWGDGQCGIWNETNCKTFKTRCQWINGTCKAIKKSAFV